MCHTTTRHSLICGHSSAHTSHCAAHRGSTLSLLTFFFSSCHPTKEAHKYHEICHDCRRFWATQNVGERDAEGFYATHRREYDCDGGWTPVLGEEPVLVKDGAAAVEMKEKIFNRGPKPPEGGAPSALTGWLIRENARAVERKAVAKMVASERGATQEAYPVQKRRASEETIWPGFQREEIVREAPASVVGRSSSLKKILTTFQRATQSRIQPLPQDLPADYDCVYDDPSRSRWDNGKCLMSGALNVEEIWLPRNSLDIAEARLPDPAAFENIPSSDPDRPQSTCDIADIEMHELPNPGDFEDAPITPVENRPQSRPSILYTELVNGADLGDDRLEYSGEGDRRYNY